MRFDRESKVLLGMMLLMWPATLVTAMFRLKLEPTNLGFWVGTLIVGVLASLAAFEGARQLSPRRWNSLLRPLGRSSPLVIAGCAIAGVAMSTAIVIAIIAGWISAAAGLSIPGRMTAMYLGVLFGLGTGGMIGLRIWIVLTSNQQQS